MLVKGAGIETSEERTIPTIGQVYALADAVTPRFRALVLLAAFGGLRRGELFGLTRGDIDLLHLTVDVRVQRQESRRGKALIGPPKTLAGRRTLALPTEVVPELEAHLARWVSVEPTASIFVGEQGGALRAGVDGSGNASDQQVLDAVVVQDPHDPQDIELRFLRRLGHPASASSRPNVPLPAPRSIQAPLAWSRAAAHPR